MQKIDDAPPIEIRLEASKTEINGSDGIGWGMARITGEIIARADGSCYWECIDGIQRDVELPSDPPSPDRFRVLWSTNSVLKDESHIQQCQEDHRLQLALCERYREKLNQMMDRARLERRLADASFFHRIRFGIVRFFRRTVSRLRRNRQGIPVGFGVETRS